MEQDARKPIILSVCGKGGVGKTSVSALLVNMLIKNAAGRVLAVDADPAEGLFYALGISVKKTVDDIRNDLISRIERGEQTDKRDLLQRLDYELFESLEERGNLACLAIGRSEQDGCYCQINTLLKELIKDLAYNFDYVVIDAEAGIEQMNRRVMELVTHLLLLTDISVKGRNVVNVLNEVAEKTISFDKAGVIFNRVKPEDEIGSIIQGMDLQVIGWIPEDETIRVFDREGKSFFDIPDCAANAALEKALEGFV